GRSTTMNNNEGSHSESFEELCALAAGAQISEAEFVEFRDHMQVCDQCRSAYGDFMDLTHSKLSLADPDLRASVMTVGLLSESSSYRERFLTRARKEGLSVSHEVVRESPVTRLRN